MQLQPYLKIALAVLLIVIGAKMIAHNHLHVPHAVSLALIAGIIGAGVAASILSTRREEAAAASSAAMQAQPPSGDPPAPVT